MFSVRQSLSVLSVVIIMLAASRSSHAVDFVHEVMPILKKHCAECHTGEKKKGGLAINTRAQLLAGGSSGDAVTPGNADDSYIIELMESKHKDEWMPPKGPRVSAKEVAVLRKWINEGMRWDAGIALGESAWEPPLQPRKVNLPVARNGRDHPIDRLLDADLAKNKLATPGSVPDRVFLRRVSLDAIGLLPTPEELTAFEGDQSGDKRTKIIDKLLADDIAYADHWLTTWNDLLRNAYTGTGFITGGRKQITGWLYASLRENKPYDQFVRELIAPTNEAAGFINGIKWRGEVNSSQTREIQFAQNISQVFLGINMKCASCHDSFIDRWVLEDAYNLAAIYASTPVEINRCDKPTGEMATPKWIFPEIGDVDPKAARDVRLKQLAGLMTHPENGRFTRTLVNRVWHRLMGRGIVHPVDAMHTRPWNEDLLDYLAAKFQADGFDLRKLIRFIMSSQAYQSRTVVLESEPGEDYVYAGPLAKRMTAEQLLDAIWQITKTNPRRPLAKVDRVVRQTAPKADPEPQAKIAFSKIDARWVWYPGTTIPKTELRKTFTLKSKPTAAILMATCDNAFAMKINGKSVASSREWTKPVYHNIVSSLRQGENTIEVAAEMFGGSAGFICQIEAMDGAQRVKVITDGSWESRKPGGKWSAVNEIGPHGSAPWRSVLNAKSNPNSTNSAGPTPPVRASLVKNDFLMRSLGRPHRDQVVTTRPAELTTLQAIDLSNGDILAGYLKAGAGQLLHSERSGDQLVRWLYRFAVSREPTEGERSVLTEVLGSGNDAVAVEDLLWMVFMQPEFQMVR